MSDIEVDGDRNRVAGRDYIEVHVSPDQDPLSPEQRRRLNRLVTEISTDYGVDPRLLWKDVVHTQTGVSKIDDIPREKFSLAEQALLDHAAQLHAQAHAKRLTAEVLEIANQRGLYQELTRFCSREFGSTILNKLSPDQLKSALRFVEERSQPQGPNQQAATAPVVTSWWAQMVELWQQKPSQAAVLVVVSAIVGRLFLG
ncbi:hypothetical protein [Aquipseudomonas alcaligenes]|uniref:Uncharacterized protein n=1 Tax=Aquipseudomonas alcaligenes TaxID=43263 RepID=A0A1N6NC84_AQUAC|nr:hypothetical protein [Pseudomonas alcaligenes]SIP89656.1 hypothetical protein SAMN05878282_101208 [Pseudomonas alcaligenes]